MFLTISLKPLQSKWRLIVKILIFLIFLCYIVPKLVLAISGISYPPTNPKLRDDTLNDGPMKVELTDRVDKKDTIT
jgi:hypothetical protein